MFCFRPAVQWMAHKCKGLRISSAVLTTSRRRRLKRSSESQGTQTNGVNLTEFLFGCWIQQLDNGRDNKAGHPARTDLSFPEAPKGKKKIHFQVYHNFLPGRE